MQNAIDELSLYQYRNFKELNIKLAPSAVLIIGDNGVGKTNILESVSMLSPGRGLRGAKLEDICQVGSNNWHIKARVQSNLGLAEISTSYDREQSRRHIDFNGSKTPSAELTKLLKIIWLTPQMNGLFLGSSSDRRKFFDRIVYCFYPAHASIINKYEYYLRERQKILQLPSIDYSWLRIIEEKLAQSALSLIHNRKKTLVLLQEALDSLTNLFPRATLEVSALDDEALEEKFYKMREQDKITGRNNFGPHRSDLVVYHGSMLASQSSTGEQKAMLISITIAQIIAVQKLSATTPILLLDEIFVHLDETRRKYLVEFLVASGSQVWITSTEDEVAEYFDGADVHPL